MEVSADDALLVNAPPLPSRHSLGRYEILERLAVGGMAEVYRARTRGLRAFEKTVALKRILPQNALDPELLQMFLDEARLMASLNHPNIAQVYDIGEEDGLPFFTMELVHGIDLRTLLRAQGRGRPLAEEHALHIGLGVAAALHHAHERTNAQGEPLGIVHRDVSPSNVLISFEGAVKLTDFGVAKWTEQASRTEAGQLKGKLAHMSPEQCLGAPLDRRTDVFALGTLLFEMLTGRVAFEADSDFALLQKIVSLDAPALIRADGSPVAEDLAAIVRGAMRRDPALRTSSAQLVQVALEDHVRREQLAVSARALAALVASTFVDKRRQDEEAERRWQTPAPDVVAASSDVTRTKTAAVESPAGAPAEDTGPKEPGRAAAPGRGRRGARWGAGAIVLAGLGGLLWWQQRPAPVATSASDATAVSASRAVSASEPAPTLRAAPAAVAPLLPPTTPVEGPEPRVLAAPTEVPSPREVTPPVDVAGSTLRPPSGPAARRAERASPRPAPRAEPASPALPPRPKVWDPDSPVPP